jgi:general secretion pathway protein E
MGIGTLLLQRGIITREQLEAALAEHRATGERLDRVLVRLGLASREQVLEAIGEQFHMPVVDLPSLAVPREVLDILPAKLVYKQNCAPIGRSDGTLTVATSDPFELTVLDELRLLTGCAIELVLADEDELRVFIRAHYGVGGDTLDAMSAGLAAPGAEGRTPRGDVESVSEVEQAQEASVIKLVNDLLVEAIGERATDVHIEPYEDRLIVRYRIDGVLGKANVPPTINRFGSAIISRLKIMANLNIAEKRVPQDGRITFRHRLGDGRIHEFDLRVSIIPMLFGEGVVLRILSKTAVLMRLTDLGMPEPVFERWTQAIAQPHGIVLVTGPTGSGKSTTLYASLNQIVSDEIKVVTVEDPVEYHVQGVNQIQVNPKVGLTFAGGLRSVLRHDPDVVMIGEIRDRETAETAVQASLTGHLVLATLHTNDAPGAMTRLLDMGIEPFLVASSLEAVAAQRLVRRICESCTRAEAPGPKDLPPGFEIPRGAKVSRGAGCRACRMTGYHGRTGMYELLRVREGTRDLVMRRGSSRQIAEDALGSGDLLPMRDDGYAKILAGVTTIAEVVRSLKE